MANLENFWFFVLPWENVVFMLCLLPVLSFDCIIQTTRKVHGLITFERSFFFFSFGLSFLTGITIIFASGDSGCGCFLCVRYTPSFPATTPSITSVGATQFLGNGGSVTPGTQEGAVSQFGSGGGMSWHFDRFVCFCFFFFFDSLLRPSYQQAAVANYIKNHGNDIPSQFHWSKSGRGTPDVAMLGSIYFCFFFFFKKKKISLSS